MIWQNLLRVVIFAATSIPRLSHADSGNPLSSEQGIQPWVADLDSESFIQRDFAARRILRSGATAVRPLLDFTRSGSETGAAVAIDLLGRLAVGSDFSTGALAHRALLQLCDDQVLSRALRQHAMRAIRTSERYVAGRLVSLGARIERNESLAIVAVQVNSETFSDQHTKLISRLESLRRVDLRSCRITDRSIEDILAFAQLTELNVADTRISSEGLLQLTSLQSLSKLTLYRLPVSHASLNLLKERLPGCDIRH